MESSARLQKSKERAVDFHINLGQNRPKERKSSSLHSAQDSKKDIQENTHRKTKK